jgi:hypothetical protein
VLGDRNEQGGIREESSIHKGTGNKTQEMEEKKQTKIKKYI